MVDIHDNAFYENDIIIIDFWLNLHLSWIIQPLVPEYTSYHKYFKNMFSVARWNAEGISKEQWPELQDYISNTNLGIIYNLETHWNHNDFSRKRTF